MRVGIDASNLRAGGGITHLMELLRAAEPEKHGVSRVIVWGGKATLDTIDERPWLERVHEPFLDRLLPVRLMWQFVRLPKLAQECCDVLFVPGGFCFGTFKPFVTMSRNLLPFETRERHRYGASWMLLKLSFLRNGQARSFRKADGVIFLNEYARSSVMKYTGVLSGHLATIPHGVNIRFFRPPAEQRPLSDYSSNNPFRFLYISIVDVYKHHWSVVEAVAATRRRGLPVELELVGPAYPAAWRRLEVVIKDLDPTGEFIHYKGPVPYSDLPGQYHGADCFVFASSCENMPNILLEAMATGLPIASSNRGPMPDVLGDAGLYFDPEDSRQIEDALLTLMERPELRDELARKAHEKAKEYSWKRCADETFAFIADVYKGHRVPY